MNVLLIEGNDAICASLPLILEEAGHTVRCAATVEAGIAYLRNAACAHVVLVSNQTPYNHSLATFFQRIIADPTLSRAHHYVALTTAPATLSPEALAILDRLRAPVIRKPFDLDELFAALAG